MKELRQVPLPSIPRKKKEGEFFLIVYPHIFRYDGRGSNIPWLQENPDPVQQTAWSGWVEIHPQTAQRLGIEKGDRVRITSDAGSIEVYALITTGIYPEAVAIAIGQGHTERMGRYARGIEGNAFQLLSPREDKLTRAPALSGMKVTLQKVAPRDLEWISGNDYNLVTLDGSKKQLGRGIGQVIPLYAIKSLSEKIFSHSEKTSAVTPTPSPEESHHPGETELLNPNGFYPPHEHPEHRWGMAIDLNACVGCGACTISCMVENNIPFVGKTQVAKGREMFWIRIERYFEGDEAGSGIRFVPMLCQQCNNAPCEPVCPVYATMHNVEGLNAMVYNRCVGTRYCSNNCPYKVRRFNWFGYDDPNNPHFVWEDPLPLMLNPDVTVRSKGVMEKCTFCIQRIRAVTEVARIEGRPVADGEIVPACAQSCPSEAIVFGDLNDPNSRVSRLARDPRGYRVLEVLNTQPAVTYLKKVLFTV
jgi:molybdopterin-containing oxidoreductase family iron-sulfur binding subunit